MQLAALLAAASIVLAPFAPAPMDAAAPALDELDQAGWTIEHADGTVGVDGAKVADAASALAVYDVPASGYDRIPQFGRWADLDHDSCDTRQEVLARDLADTILDTDCAVLSGTLDDPYTGTTSEFLHDRAGGSSSAVQIDHIVPLGAAWYGGAGSWTKDERVALANDPANLLAVDGPANGSKGDQLAGHWMPQNSADWCEYVAQQTWVLAKYGIAVMQSDRDALVEIASGCSLGEAAATDPAESTASPTQDQEQDEGPSATSISDAQDEAREDAQQVSPATILILAVAAIALAWWLCSRSRRGARSR